MRGNVLNKKGLYNRCKLTRLVVDEEWEQKVWKDSWTPRVVELDEECIGAGGGKGRKRGSDGESHKRRKMDRDDGVAWGEYTPVAEESRNDFLYGTPKAVRRAGRLTQMTVKTVSGVEWMSRMLLKDLADSAVDHAEWVKEASSWEEWREEEIKEQESKRTVQEERWLWKRLEESDNQQAKEERYNTLKKNRKVAKAREKMKVGKEQPGIMDKLRRVSTKVQVQDGDGLQSQEGVQEGNHQLVAREDQGGDQRGGQHGDGAALSAQSQGGAQQDDGDIV